jgi:hypothetical protein
LKLVLHSSSKCTRTRWSAQRALLGRSGVAISVLGWMYGLPRGIPTGFDKEHVGQLGW